MKRVALALLACTAWTATAAAMDEPAPSAQDSRIRTASYSADNVIHITSTDLNPVQIVLQDGEVVASFSGLLVNTGDDARTAASFAAVTGSEADWNKEAKFWKQAGATHLCLTTTFHRRHHHRLAGHTLSDHIAALKRF